MKVKRLFLILTIMLVTLPIIFHSSSAYAATSMELGILSIRSEQYGYQANGKNVWKIVEYTHGGYTYDKAIYCMKGGPGFGGSDYIENRVYNVSYDMKKYGAIPTEEKNVLPSDVDKTFSMGGDTYTYTDYNAILWLLDNAYLPNDENVIDLKETLFNRAFPGVDHEEILLTDDDIEVVQQCAIWYFTNSEGNNPYHMQTLPALQLTTQEGGQGPFDITLDDLDPTFSRQTQASDLYDYFINTARVKASVYGKGDVRGETTIPAEFVDTVTSTTVSGGKCIVGPFKINENSESNSDYAIEEIIKDHNGNQIYNYTLLDSNKKPLSEETTLKDIVNTDFYIMVNDDEYMDKLTLEIVIKYYETTATFWTVGGAVAVEQPVVVIDKQLKEISKSIETSIVRKPFDLALRKFITQINSQNVQSREPQVDVSPLLNGGTTATYTHTKAPLTVTKGDIVKYKIRVYNEGEISGYAEQIADYLPSGLGFLVGHKTNIENGWELPNDSGYETVSLNEIENAANNLKVTDFNNINSLNEVEIAKGKVKLTTNKLKYVGNNTTNLIKAFDKSAQEPTLDYKDVEVVCVVLEENIDNPELKNIAEIAKDLDEQGNEIKDRDSTTDSVNVNTYPENSNIEDDDDYEQLILKPFDLALRKFITQINSQDVQSREPQVDVSPLLNGKTTATYTHTKAPLTVAKGDIVKYKIRIYNEGEISGYAEQIADYLPSGLGFLVGHKTNIQNGWELPNDSGYETVPLSEIENAGNNLKLTDFNNINSLNDVQVARGKVKLTTNKLKYEENSTKNLIKAFDKTAQNPTLDYKDVEVVCVVLEENIDNPELKNIAEITKDLNEVGGEVTDRDSTPDTVVPERYPSNSNIEDDDDYEQLILKPFDLALRKFITKINSTDINSREPEVDLKTLRNGTTATYTHPKSPLAVEVGDIVTYTIRVYNEGEIAGYAHEISDYIPEGLGFLVGYNTNVDNYWMLPSQGELNTVKLNTISNGTKNVSLSDFQLVNSLDEVDVVKGKVKVSTNKLKYDPDNNENLLKPYDRTSNTSTLDYKDVQVTCIVLNTDGVSPKLKNIAEITKDLNETGGEVTDRDSTPDTVVPEQYPSNSNIEDDDDYEQLALKAFDLALRKFITGVQDREIVDRIPTPVIDNITGKIRYDHTKEPVRVQHGNTVIYTIRVYNEGYIDGYASEVRDDIPEGLEFDSTNQINIDYEWQLTPGGTYVYTEYLSKKAEDENEGRNNLIVAFDRNTMTGPAYKDVKIAFKVIEPAISNRILINTAEIGDDSNSAGDEIDDIDSTPGNGVPSEDDIDIEKVQIVNFDLSLKKFITQVNDSNVSGREPKVSLDSNGNLSYTYVKDPVTVRNNDIVIYTIRIYNEGNIDGYASEIKDDVPAGLIFLPEHEINMQYRWNLSEDGTIRTDYLSEEQTVDNLIKAFDKDNMEQPNYKDVKVAFKVEESAIPDTRIIINTAEISKDDNEFDAPDIDSTPDNNVPTEDDIDKEYLIVQYFDLSLLKWVSKVEVTEDGKTTVTQTNFTGLENPDPIVKVDINKKKINKTTVKFIYTIKITNEGQIEGYAKEIRDDIPEGLEFRVEDNKNWYIDDNGRVVTNALENTLLYPGESATVDITLRWINSENNLGVKINVAEISEDYNKPNSPDIDSTPDNKVPGEDDIDEAPVVLSLITGSAPLYIGLTTSVLVLLGGGIFLIKRYVL